MKVTFTVEGQPVGKKRARTQRGRGRPYTPGKTRSYEHRVGWTVRSTKVPSGWPIDKGRFAVFVGAYFSDRRPRDLDNVLKSLLDGCNSILFRDDSQVDLMAIERCYDADNPRAEVIIKAMEPS